MSVILTAGQAGDNPQLLPLLDQIGVGRDAAGAETLETRAKGLRSQQGEALVFRSSG